jgi:hypothetical protein
MFRELESSANWGNVMKTELGLTFAAIVATLPLLSANAAETLEFGPNLPTGTVPDGYGGFDWHGAQNGVFYSTNDFASLYVTEMSRAAPFDLNSLVVRELMSSVPSPGETSNYMTTISGYLNGTLVQTFTANYAWGSDPLLTLNMDNINDVKFATTNIRTSDAVPGTFSIGDLFMMSEVTVTKSVTMAVAPEMDPATAASAFTLLIGGLLVMTSRARRTRSIKASPG